MRHVFLIIIVLPRPPPDVIDFGKVLQHEYFVRKTTNTADNCTLSFFMYEYEALRKDPRPWILVKFSETVPNIPKRHVHTDIDTDKIVLDL